MPGTLLTGYTLGMLHLKPKFMARGAGLNYKRALLGAPNEKPSRRATCTFKKQKKQKKKRLGLGIRIGIGIAI